MAARTATANVIARVEPDIKEKAEAIMAQLDIPTSVLIDALYKQIILTNGIPFPLSVPTAPTARDEMDTASFNAMMQRGLNEAQNDHSLPADEVFAQLQRGIR